MALYEEILQMYPTRKTDRKTAMWNWWRSRSTGYWRKAHSIESAATAGVLKEADGSFAVVNEPSGPPPPDGTPGVEGPQSKVRPVADAILILKK